jgi:hypothetical protein
VRAARRMRPLSLPLRRDERALQPPPLRIGLAVAKGSA